MKETPNTVTRKSFHVFFSFILLSYTLRKIIASPKPMYKCGPDNGPIYKMNISDIRVYKDPKRKRDLEGENDFKNLSIYIDTLNLEKEMEQYELTSNKNLYINGMQKAKKTLESLLKVKKPTKNYGITDEEIKSILINYWNETMVGNKSEGMEELGIDLYIFARFATDDEMSSSTLASAGPRYVDETNRPIVGIVNINKKIDFTYSNSQNYFEFIIIHEFTHVLGFSGYYVSTIYNLTFSKIGVNGIKRTFLKGPKLLEVAKKYYNCSDIEGVELENYGASGTIGSHWEARILLGEYMNGYIYTPDQVISEFTLAALEDLSYYKANYYTGGLMKFGKNKGCDFVNKECIINGKANEKFSNEFYDDAFGYGAGCSSARQSRAYRFIGIYNDDLPTEYQYFSEPFYGGPLQQADFCPVSVSVESKSYYIGSCLRGNGNYGYYLHYHDITQEHTSDSVDYLFHEEYSNNSFCVISSLINDKSENKDYYVKDPRPVCYEMFCSEKSLTIKISDEFFVCPRAGGKIKATGFVGYLLCPDYYLICSGTVMCNDMYDCVEKKSEIKEESYTLDYESRTKQNIDVANDDKFDVDNYELSKDGICPQYCTRCNSNSQCIECKEGYEFIEDICLFKVLYCETYSNEVCSKCLSGYKLDDINNECIPCDNEYYSNNGLTCDKCNDTCASCNSTNGYCLSCKDGSLNIETGVCTPCDDRHYSDGKDCIEIKCDASCINCFKFDICAKDECKISFNLDNATTDCTTTTAICNEGYYFKNETEGCVKCNNLCSSCNRTNGHCISCIDGSLNTETGICTPCKDNHYSDGKNCIEIICNPGCLICKNKDGTNCTSCLQGYFLSGNVCNECESGSFSLGGVQAECSKCDTDTCESCDNKNGNCLSCKAGFGYQNGQKSCILCDEGTHYSIGGQNTCNKCIDCSICDSKNGKCTSCEIGYILNKSEGKCTECLSGSYSLGGENEICVILDYIFIVDSTKTYEYTCSQEEGYIITINGNLENKTGIFVSGLEFYVETEQLNKNMDCKLLNINQLTCSIKLENETLTIKTNENTNQYKNYTFIQINNKNLMVKNWTKEITTKKIFCPCPTGTYLSTLSNNENSFYCMNCPNTCLSCSSPQKCSECKNGLVKQDDNICLSCLQTLDMEQCESCEIIKNEAQCIKCFDGNFPKDQSKSGCIKEQNEQQNDNFILISFDYPSINNNYISFKANFFSVNYKLFSTFKLIVNITIKNNKFRNLQELEVNCDQTGTITQTNDEIFIIYYICGGSTENENDEIEEFSISENSEIEFPKGIKTNSKEMNLYSLEDSTEDLYYLKNDIKTYNFKNILQKDGWTYDGYSFTLSSKGEISNDEEKIITLDTSDIKAKAECTIPKGEKISNISCFLKYFNSNNGNITISNGRYYNDENMLDAIVFVSQNINLTVVDSKTVIEKKNNNISKGAIIGIVTGICVVVILVTVIIFCRKGHCTNSDDSNKNSSSKNQKSGYIKAADKSKDFFQGPDISKSDLINVKKAV